MMHGGRLVSFFVQFVFVPLGKVWFDIANAFVFAAMCAVLLMHCRRRLAFADEPGMLFAIGAFLGLGLSHFGEVAIWLCGAAVYLWTGLLAAMFWRTREGGKRFPTRKSGCFLSAWSPPARWKT